LIALVIASTTSCTSILRRTLGKYLYKKDFLPTLISEDIDFYTEIPYELREGWTIIKVKLNDNPKEYNFLFDTGARCYITDSIAKTLGLSPMRFMKSEDINGSVAYAGLHKVALTIGEFKINNVGVLSKSNFDNLSNNCFQIDGIIGANILNQGVFHFDSDNKILIVTNLINKVSNSKRGVSVKLIAPNWSGQSFVKMKVNNKKGRFQFDTGSANLLDLKQKKRDDQIPIKRRISYIGGLHSSKLDTISFYKIKSIKIGKEETENFNESVAISHTGSTNILGNKILEKYLVTLDRRNKRLYLSPRVFQTENETLRISNLQLHWKSGITFVSSLTIGCELQNMGLSIGDTITFINDIRTDFFKDYCTFKSFKDSLIVNIKDNALIFRTRRGTLEKTYIVTSNLFYD